MTTAKEFRIQKSNMPVFFTPALMLGVAQLFALLYIKVFASGLWQSKTGICSRQDAKNAKSGSLISLRPLRLCARYSDFWLWPGHATFFAVTYSP
jgi:hypothetical protein